MTWKLDSDLPLAESLKSRDNQSSHSGCQVVGTKIVSWIFAADPFSALLIPEFSLPAWKRMKSCYSSTELATKVAFVVRKVGNFGKETILILYLSWVIRIFLSFFFNREEAERFVFNSLSPFPFTLCRIDTHSNAWNVFLFICVGSCLFYVCFNL